MTKKVKDRDNKTSKKKANVDDKEYETVPEHKWMEFKDMIDRYFDHPEELDRYNKDSKILILDETQIMKFLTRERIRILKKIKEKEIENLTDLAESLGRDPSAVNRDIKILENLGIIHREKAGKNVIPVLDTEIILLPISQLNLFDLLKNQDEEKASLQLPIEQFEIILLMDFLLKEIIARLDNDQIDYDKLIDILTPWLNQELQEIPERITKRLKTLPAFCWIPGNAP